MRQERICFTRGGILCPRGMLLLFWLLLLYAACFSRANEENRDSGDGTAVRKKDFPTSIQGVLKLQGLLVRRRSSWAPIRHDRALANVFTTWYPPA